MADAMTTTTIDKVVTEGREIIAVSSEDTLTQVIRTLGQNHIFSAPVVRKDGMAAGFVDWLDILGNLTEVVSEEKQSRVTPASRSLTTDDMSMLMDRANSFALRTVETRALANKSRKDPWKTLKVGDTLQKAMKVLSLYHHVAVERDGKLVNILSQMDLLRWLHSEPQRMGPEGRKTLQGLHLHRKRVVCVRETDLTVDAFYTIFKDFLAEEGSEPVAMHHFDTLGDVVAKMVAHHVHRVFIVGPGGFPMGVVSTTDVCRVFGADKDEKEDSKKKKKDKKEKKEEKKDDEGKKEKKAKKEDKKKK